MVAQAKKLQRYRVQSRKRTLREISNELAKVGFVTGTGKPYAGAVVAKIAGA